MGRVALSLSCPRCEAAPWMGCEIGQIGECTIRSQSSLHLERLRAAGDQMRERLHHGK